MLRAVLALFAAALIVTLLLFSPASADTGTTSLANGAYKTWEIDTKRSFHLSYDIEVTNGLVVNVLLLTAADYAQFVANGTYSYIGGGSYLGTNHAVADLDMNEGKYFLIVENTVPSASSAEASNDSASLSYHVNVMESQGNSSLVLLLIIGVIVIFIMVIIILVDVVRNRQR